MRTRSPQALPPAKPSPSGSGTRPASSRSLEPQHQTDRARAPQLRGAARDGVGGEHAVPVLAERAEAQPQRAARLVGRHAHGRQRRARARLRAGAGRPGRGRDALPRRAARRARGRCRPSISASECPGVRSARSPTNVDARHAAPRAPPRRRRARRGSARSARGRRARRPAPRPARPPARRSRCRAAARAPGRRRRARAASVARPRPQSSPAPFGPPSLWPATAAVTSPGSEPMSTVERRAGLHGVEVQRHAALGADRGRLGDRLDHARQIAGPDQAADEVAGLHGLVERARPTRARRRRPGASRPRSPGAPAPPPLRSRRDARAAS